MSRKIIAFMLAFFMVTAAEAGSFGGIDASLRAEVGTLTPFGFVSTAEAASKSDLDIAAEKAASFMLKAVSKPSFGDVGGEWAVLGLARYGAEVPKGYYEAYYQDAESYVAEKKGKLHDKKYTEYSRAVIALSAIGADARDVGGYDLTYALGDYEKTIWQGLNGPIWALIALDSRDYPMPENKEAAVQATRQMYIDRILSCQLEDGGWSLFGGTENATSAGDKISDPDITGMALQALAKYRDQPAVKKATEDALSCMSKVQNEDAGFGSWGTDNLESAAQILVAMCELGLPLDDSRFVKNGKTVLDNVLSYQTAEGGFTHVFDGSDGNNQMSAEQGFYALVAAKRAAEGKNSLYRMGDAEHLAGKAMGDSSLAGDAPSAAGATTGGPQIGASPVGGGGSEQSELTEGVSYGLPGKSELVHKVRSSMAEAAFNDIDGNAAKDKILALAQREIINGMSDGIFAPDESMTRAQFCAITVRALGIDTDLDPSSLRSSGIQTGDDHSGTGTSSDSREEGALQVSETLSKVDEKPPLQYEVFPQSGQGEGDREAAPGFSDVPESSWYAPYVKTASALGIVNGVGDGKFNPQGTITRQEAAAMVARAAKLCGFDTEYDTTAARDVLAQFTDYITVSEWARPSMAFCFDKGILDDSALEIGPKKAILRAEIAEMLYNMLDKAKLL